MVHWKDIENAPTVDVVEVVKDMLKGEMRLIDADAVQGEKMSNQRVVEWIPVSERLPDYNGYDEVITVVNGRHGNTQYIDGVCTNVEYDDIDELWYINDVYEPNITVKAWMPLPSYEDAPTVDIVRHGTWTERYMEDDECRFTRRRWYCSECGKWQCYGKSDYCLNCGAKMDREAEGDKR